MATGRYQYMFGNWQTARVDTTISLFGVYIVGKLNDVGYMQGSFQLDQFSKTQITNAELLDATTPFRNFILVVRDNVPIWGGYITSRTYQSQSKSIQLYAKAYEGYPDERIVPLAEYNHTGDPNDSYITPTGGKDQGFIFKDLIGVFESDETPAGPLFPLHFDAADSNVPFEDVGFPEGPITGVTRSVEVYRTDYKTHRQIIDEIANGDNGFDWRIVPRFLSAASGMTHAATGSNFSTYEGLTEGIEVHKYVKFGYPTLDAGVSGDAFVFEYPGNILNYYRTDNLAGSGTTVIGVGAGQGPDMIRKEVADQSIIDVRGGYFPKDVVVPLKHIDSQGILDSRTMQEAAKRKPPKITYKVSVRPDKSPVFGTYDLGSAATLIIRDAMHPEGISVRVVVNEYALRPPSQDGAEQIDIGFVGEFE